MSETKRPTKKTAAAAGAAPKRQTKRAAVQEATVESQVETEEERKEHGDEGDEEDSEKKTTGDLHFCGDYTDDVEFDYLPVSRVSFETRAIFFGGTGSGKTTAVMNLLHLMNFARGIVMCPSPEVFDNYGDWVPPLYLYDEWNSETLAKITILQGQLAAKATRIFKEKRARLEMLAEQEEVRMWQERCSAAIAEFAARGLSDDDALHAMAVVKGKFEKEKSDRFNARHRVEYPKMKREIRAPYSIFVILDDVGPDKDAMKTPIMKKWMCTCRHYMIAPFMCVQDVMDFPCDYRVNLDWLFLFNEKKPKALDRMYNSYVGVFPTRAKFRSALQKASSKNCALVINVRERSDDIKKCVFLFKSEFLTASEMCRARNGIPYLGCAEYRLANELYFNKVLIDENQSLSEEQMAAKIDKLVGNDRTVRRNTKSKTASGATATATAEKRSARSRSDAKTTKPLDGAVEAKLNRLTPEERKLVEKEMKRISDVKAEQKRATAAASAAPPEKSAHRKRATTTN